MLPSAPQPPPRRCPPEPPLHETVHPQPDARGHASPTLLHGAAIAIPDGTSSISGLRFGDLADLGADWGAFAVVLGRELRRPHGAGAVGDSGALTCSGLQGRVLVRDISPGGGVLALIAHLQPDIVAAAAARVVLIGEATHDRTAGTPAARLLTSAAPSAAVDTPRPTRPALTVTPLFAPEDARGALWPRRPWRLRLAGAGAGDVRVQAALASWLGLPADAIEAQGANESHGDAADALDAALWAARATLLALKSRLPVRLPLLAVAGRLEAS